MSRQLVALVLLLSVLAQSQALEISKNWGAITVKNNGGYTAKFTIDYFQNGQQKQEDSGKFPVGQARSLSIPPNAEFVLVRGYVDIFINNWSVIFNDAINIPLIKCYNVGGTTLNTNWGVVDGCQY